MVRGKPYTSVGASVAFFGWQSSGFRVGAIEWEGLASSGSGSAAGAPHGEAIATDTRALEGISAASVAHSARHEIVFIDRGIHDFDTVLAGIKPGVDVVVLDSHHDALDQIAQAVEGQHFSAIHVISDGAKGTFAFSSGAVTLDSLGAHAGDLQTIGHALGHGGDLMLWGCNVGAGDAGKAFVDALAQHTGADVAASNDLTGSHAMGGDWALEVHTGPIQTHLPMTHDAAVHFDATLSVGVTAVQSSVLTVDNDSDGVIDPGDTITTSVTITNNMGSDATGVSFNETLTGMTQVANSVTVTPIAFDDGYSLEGNTPITISAPSGLLANDIDPDASTPLSNTGLTIAAASQGTHATAHGSVNIGSDGSFTYTPNTGFEGTDTFTYTVHDAQGLDSDTTGTVTMTVGDDVWYVDSAAAGGGDGSYDHPFTTLGTVASVDSSNDTIFVVNNGSAYSQAAGLTLESGEKFLGDGSSLTTVNGHTVGVSASNSTFTATGNGATAVTLGSGNTVSGLNINETGTSGNGIVDNGSSVGTLHLIGVGVGTTGNGISLTHGGTVDATGTNTISATGGTALNVTNTTISASGLAFHDISANGGAKGIVLNNTGSTAGLTISGTGTTNGSGGTIQNITGRGIEIQNASHITLSNMALTSASTTDGAVATDSNTSSLNAALYLNSVNTAHTAGAGVVLNNIDISGTNQEGVIGVSVDGLTLNGSTIDHAGSTDSAEEGAIKMREVTGTVTMNNDDFSFSGGQTVEIKNTTGNLILNIDSTTMRDTQSSASGQGGLQVITTGTTSVHPSAVVNVTNDSFLRLRTHGVNIQSVGTTDSGSANSDVDITGSTFDPGNAPGTMIGIDLDADDASTLLFNVVNNDHIQARNGPAMNIFGDVTSHVEGRINNNPDITVFDNPGGSQVGTAVRVNLNKDATGVIQIDNNAISSFGDDGGIEISDIGQTNTNTGQKLEVSVTNNTIAMDGSTTYGVFLLSASGASDHNVLVANVQNNAVTNPGIFAFRARAVGASGILQMQGFNTDAGHTWDIRGNTPVGSTSFGGSGTFGAGTPALPSNPAVDADALATPGGVQPDPTPRDPSKPPVSPSGAVDFHLTQADVNGLLGEAIARWEATGLTASQDAYIHNVTISIQDMSGWTLGSATPGHITLDDDAAGHGWFVDATPQDDKEFSVDKDGALYTTPDQTPAGHIDLLTTLMHELGHQLGLADTYSLSQEANLMYGYIVDGERRLPAAHQADGAVEGSITHEEFAVGPVSLGTLPDGKSVTISWQAIIDSQSNDFAVNPVNHGTVSGGNFTTFDTNDDTVPLDTLTLGNLIFNDADADGTFDNSDVGVNGVALTLFADDGTTAGVWDAGDTEIGTTTTAGGGLYSFTGLAPGSYIVRIDASNFTSGHALEGFTDSSPVRDTTPDDNIDDDSNGNAIAGGVIYTNAITLSYNNEPTAGTGNDTNNTLDIGVIQNQAPVLAGGGNAVGYTENGSAVAIDAALTVADADNANLAGATVEITSGYVSGDTLNFSTQNGISGSYDSGTHTLTLTGSASVADYQTALRSVTFSSSSDDPTSGGNTSRTITWQADDGQIANNLSNTPTTTVNITAVNDEPTLLATGATPTFTENGSAVDLFSAVTASTIEAGQTFASMTLTVTNVTDGSSEVLHFDGSDVALTDANSVVTATNALSVGVSVSGTTATVSFSGAALSAAQLQTLVDGLTYTDTSEDPTDANRTITITQLVDFGLEHAAQRQHRHPEHRRHRQRRPGERCRHRHRRYDRQRDRGGRRSQRHAGHGDRERRSRRHRRRQRRRYLAGRDRGHRQRQRLRHL